MPKGFPGLLPLEHGTLYGYKMHKCRCLECRSANATYRKMERDRHGTRAKYESGCRCQLCGAANNEYLRKWKQGLVLRDPFTEATYAPALSSTVNVRNQTGRVIGHWLRANTAVVQWIDGTTSRVHWDELED